MRFRFADFVLDEEQFELRRGADVVPLEPQVLKVIAYLAHHSDRVVPKEELLDEIWGSRFVSESALTSRIKSARQALGDSGEEQAVIKTLRGVGFRLVAPVVREQPETHTTDPSAGDSSRSVVPMARVSMVGRVGDRAVVQASMARHRIVTITGPGGVGKTTLAIEVARAALENGSTAVVFVELATSHGRLDVLRAVANAVGVEGAGVTDPAALGAFIGARPFLLVLDNCEHVVAAAADVVDAVVDAGDQVTVLVTSREPLGVDGEALHRLGSLGADATQLFVDRATTTAGVAPLSANDRRVIEICQRLDGLPLAIELAAAQLRHLSVDELLERLDERLDLLRGGRPRAGARHSALAATIDWSYGQLDESSRLVFDRLGVFPASFDLAAVESINPDLDRNAVVVVVADLVAKSLVVHIAETGRYQLLESIRLFATNRLARSGERDDVTERLRRHVVGLTTIGTRPDAWLSAARAALNRRDIENFRLAFDASLDARRLGDAIDIALGLTAVWRNASDYTEGLTWRGRILEHSDDVDVADRPWLEIIGCDLGLGSGDPSLMLTCADAAIASLEVRHDPPATVIATVYRSLVLNDPRSPQGLARARSTAIDIGDDRLERLASGFLTVSHLLTAGVGAIDRDEVERRADGAGNDYDRYIAIWAAWVGALATDDHVALRRWMDAQLDNVVSSGLRENWLTMFCGALTLIGEGADHRPQLRNAMRHAEAEGRSAEADCILALGYAAHVDGDDASAAELLAAASGDLFHDTANYIHHTVIQDLVVRPRMSPADFAGASDRGRGVDLADIIATSMV